MTALFIKKFLTVVLFFFSIAIGSMAQTVELKYSALWKNYTDGSGNRPDTNYTCVDTSIELTLRKDGTYNMRKQEAKEIFTPGKGYKRFKKTFRVMDGNYRIVGDSLELLTGYKAGEAGLTIWYEFETVLDRFKQENRYYKLWDTHTFYEFRQVSAFNIKEQPHYSRKRSAKMLYTAAANGTIKDSIAYWSTSPDCENEYYWPRPVLLNDDVPMQNNTFTFISKMNDLTEKTCVFDNTARLVRYYYTSKLDKSYYYTIEYTDTSQYNITVKTITDSKDGSVYQMIRDPKDCLLKIEHYDAEKRLMETYFAKLAR